MRNVPSVVEGATSSGQHRSVFIMRNVPSEVEGATPPCSSDSCLAEETCRSEFIWSTWTGVCHEKRANRIWAAAAPSWLTESEPSTRLGRSSLSKPSLPNWNSERFWSSWGYRVASRTQESSV
ncbi:hypothetical protein RRG08_061378 [Elysia crispata]|uniref:Uncharacterized protein n=1 Tax=Elysia crispata TaxID=231223 RepID=A0AAE1DXY9_9GAST|nr:hypothetical protein RRG08_061378 [Elysia crispata]